MKIKKACLFILLSSFTILLAILSTPAMAADINCLKCHGKLTIGKSVHKALNMGCPTCHSGIDAKTVPHKKTNALSKGISSDQPGLCFGCHDKSMFERKNVHAAVGMGCTGCHDPHSSKNPQLLKSAVPELCFSCHDKSGFSKQNVHPPVASGECTTCHTPHSSDWMALLMKKPVEVCLQCHPDATHGSHIPSRRKEQNEQSKGTSTESEPQDPKRPGKPFYCGSCHDPHSTDGPLLFRFNAQSMQDLCVNCHKF